MAACVSTVHFLVGRNDRFGSISTDLQCPRCFRTSPDSSANADIPELSVRGPGGDITKLTCRGSFLSNEGFRNISRVVDEALNYWTDRSILQYDERDWPRPYGQIDQQDLQGKSLRVLIENRSWKRRDISAGRQQIAPERPMTACRSRQTVASEATLAKNLAARGYRSPHRVVSESKAHRPSPQDRSCDDASSGFCIPAATTRSSLNRHSICKYSLVG